MTIFKCDACDYETKDSSNFKKHNESKKHMLKTELYNNAKKTIVKKESPNNNVVLHCVDCNMEFKHRSSLSRHKKHFCIRNKIDKDGLNAFKYQIKIKDLENELIKKDLEITKRELQMVKSQGEQDKYKTVADIYKGENEFHKTLSVNAGNVLGKTVNALTYIMENYNKAPELKLLDNETAMKLLKYETKDGEITNLITGKTPLQYLLDLHENNKLVSHLGNLIISQYKKLNPCDQSLWNTDASRLTYAVRNSTIDKERKTKNLIWDSDKRGIKINNCIITPLLEQLKDMIMKYDKDINNRFDDMSQSQRDKYADNSIHTIDIKQGISTSSLHKSILRYIAPYFHMSKCKWG
jgi:hypothetical protein